MVSFNCDGCGDVVKKPKLDQHYQRCYAPVTCLDCSVQFSAPAEWKSHTTCISEAQKYERSVYRGPAKAKGKGVQQQQESKQQQQQHTHTQPRQSQQPHQDVTTTKQERNKETSASKTSSNATHDIEGPSVVHAKGDSQTKKRKRDLEGNTSVSKDADTEKKETHKKEKGKSKKDDVKNDKKVKKDKKKKEKSTSDYAKDEKKEKKEGDEKRKEKRAKKATTSTAEDLTAVVQRGEGKRATEEAHVDDGEARKGKDTKDKKEKKEKKVKKDKKAKRADTEASTGETTAGAYAVESKPVDSPTSVSMAAKQSAHALRVDGQEPKKAKKSKDKIKPVVAETSAQTHPTTDSPKKVKRQTKYEKSRKEREAKRALLAHEAR